MTGKLVGHVKGFPLIMTGYIIPGILAVLALRTPNVGPTGSICDSISTPESKRENARIHPLPRCCILILEDRLNTNCIRNSIYRSSLTCLEDRSKAYIDSRGDLLSLGTSSCIVQLKLGGLDVAHLEKNCSASLHHCTWLTISLAFDKLETISWHSFLRRTV